MKTYTKQQLVDRNAELVRQCDKLLMESTGLQATLNGLRKLLGYTQNGSSTTVTLSQDDATNDFCLTVGKKTYYSQSFSGVIAAAITDNPEN